ncbi:Islet amyloid polypeptide [Oryzias melastigma]|uniref:Islet amyloid polypeptide n=1 Tax=Oryzias melastigma TaxID=30732 RepID=A0A834BZ53_ORYME|nr:Islet amyloid polypeptide [Oryzias melastigma]
MYHLRVHRLLLLVLLFLRCIVAAPNHRYFSTGLSFEQEHLPPESEDWTLPELIANPFLRLLGPRTQRELTPTNSHHLEKRKCNTATCVTQRLADFLVRSSNTIGTVYVPTNVGSATYGKRGLRQPPTYLSL